jgi:hypothetical protein
MTMQSKDLLPVNVMYQKVKVDGTIKAWRKNL